MDITGQEATEYDEAQRLSPAEKYSYEWKILLSSLSNNLESLRQQAFMGELKVSKFRSICWSLLLRVINDSSNHWMEQKDQQRKKYEKLKEEFARNPHKGDSDDDPLSQSKQSIWNQYFGDQELFAVIKQDVVRTFPGVDFFRKPFIQEAMTNILFYYAREHPYMCYRQGMHEILAPILFVMHCDHQSLLHLKEIATDIDELLLHVLDPKYLEADSYSIFSRLMSSIESYYRITNLIPTSEGYFPVQTELNNPEENAIASEVEVIRQLNFIKDKILAKEDLHLHNHLLKLDIPLHIFGIRWLRLLFGREFPLQDLLMLWDAIFADSDRFELPNYIVVAMLIRIRDKLLLSDYTTCLTYLMRYPNNVDISLIMRHALHMQMPKKYERPSNAIIYVTMKPTENSQPSTQVSPSAQKQSTRLGAIPKQFSDSSEKISQRNRSSSFTGESKDLTLLKLSDIQFTNALNAARYASYTADRTSDTKIIEGYREDSPQFLLLELQNAQSIMVICRLKLRKYLSTLRTHVSKNQTDEVNQALDGIEQICAFLDVKFTIPNNPVTQQPVDQALEANEPKQSKKTQNVVTKSPQIAQAASNASNKLPRKKSLSDAEVKKEFVKKLEASKYPLETGIDDNGEPTGFRQAPEPEFTSITSGTRYEIPDNGYMEKSIKFLGTRKDVELTIFREDHIHGADEISGIPTPDPLGLRDN